MRAPLKSSLKLFMNMKQSEPSTQGQLTRSLIKAAVIIALMLLLLGVWAAPVALAEMPIASA